MFEVVNEVLCCCIFVIIFYFDVGKIMLIEKLLLFGGVIQMVGLVKGCKVVCYVIFDWMVLEKECGIFVIFLVMQFLYEGKIVNLFDIFGYVDFGEDIYCVLIVVDLVLMVIDVVKGVEECIIKLMEVCCLCDILIMIFINKFDCEGKDLIELLDEVEIVFGIQCVLVIWLIGMGQCLKGVVYLLIGEVYLYELGCNFICQDLIIFLFIDVFGLVEKIGVQMLVDLCDELELVQGVSYLFDLDVYCVGKQILVFFGLGVNNFGVQLLLDFFVEYVLLLQV